MPTFDLQSTLLLVALLSLVQTGIMTFTYCVSSYEHGVGQWVLANAAFAGSCIVLLLRGPIPEQLSIVATNFFLLLGSVLLLDGIARFLRVPVRHLSWIYFSTIALMAPIAAFTFIWPDLTMRIVIVSLAVAVILVPCIWLLVRHAPLEITAAARFTTFAITLGAVVSLIRGIGVALQPVNGIFQSNLAQDIGFVGALIGAASEPPAWPEWLSSGCWRGIEQSLPTAFRQSKRFRQVKPVPGARCRRWRRSAPRSLQ